MNKIIRLMLVIGGYVACCWGQLENYTDNSTVVKCKNAYLVGLEFKNDQVGFDVSDDEKIKYNGILADKLSRYIGMPLTVINSDDVDRIINCEAQVISVRLDDYHTKPAKMDQHVGIISLTIYFFHSPKDHKPNNSFTVTAQGERHWGNSTPLENALEAVVEKIKVPRRKK